MKIDKDVPLPFLSVHVDKGIDPPRDHPPYYRNSIPTEFSDMVPGDSVWAHRDQTSRIRRWAIKAFGSGNYTTRREGDGIRLWRLEERK